jgi:hypothetical protein
MAGTSYYNTISTVLVSDYVTLHQFREEKFRICGWGSSHQPAWYLDLLS